MRLFSNFLHFIQGPSFQAEGAEGSSVAEMIDLMGSDDNPDEGSEKIVTDTEGTDLLADDKKGKEKEEKEETKETKGEKEGEEQEEVELSEEELDDIGDFNRKEFLKAYPDAFKKFPMLERAFYREQKYAEIYPTLEDASTAHEKSQQYDQFSDAMLKGETNVLLSSIKDADPKAFTKVVDTYLDSLAAVDKDAYYHVIGNNFRLAIQGMVQEAERIKGEAGDNLKQAALILNQYMFGNSQWKAPEKYSKDTIKNEDQEKLDNDRKQFLQERFDNALSDLSTTSRNIIKHTISEHIDPKDSMTDYVKRVAINEALDNVEAAIEADARFKATLDKLWEKAFEQKFSRPSLDNIRKAYLNKAKTLLPQFISKSRNAALKGLGKRVTEEKEEVRQKGPVAANRPASANNRGDGKSVPKGMKTLDYLMSDD